jgi:anaerobic selenocysteine-containing dehydrogenase
MEYRNTLTTCVYCGCGCGIYVETMDGQITGVWPPKTHPVSQGKLCIKGWNVTDFVEHPDFPDFGQVHQRGKLCAAKVRPRSDRHQQRRSLCPSLTRPHGGRSGRLIWERGND